MIRFGISFDGFSPIRDAIVVAQKAESYGASSFCIAEHLGFREPFMTATALGLATRSARLVPTAVSPYVHHPIATAMALASLGELLPDRAAIAVGVGNPLFLRESGLSMEKPIRAVREFVQALRAMARTEPVHQQAQRFQLNGARIAFAPASAPPIYLAPMGPQMLKLSGQIADGLVLSAGLSLQFIERSLAIATAAAQEAGRDPSTLHRSAYIHFIGGGEPKAQRIKVRQKLAFLFRNENLRENIAASGLPIDQPAIMAAVARRDMDTALALVPDEAADAFAIVGDERRCLDRIEAYRATGLDELVFSLTGTAEDKDRSLEILRALSGRR